MQKIFGIEIDIASMSTEELQETRNKAREILSNVEHQLLLRKMSERRFKSPKSSDTA